MRRNPYTTRLLLVLPSARHPSLPRRPTTTSDCCCLYFSTSPSRLPPSFLSPPTFSSSSSSSNWRSGRQFHRHNRHRPHRSREEGSRRSVVVRVWWDLENCQIPKGVDPYHIARRITRALRFHGIRGPLTITAFGDMLHLSHKILDALCTTGISLHCVPNRGKNSADRSIIADIASWISQNPPPAHFFLISGDTDFADILHRLRMNNYNILIASSDGASAAALCSAATIMWCWNGLVRGDELTGRYLNCPPDGQRSSWYGNYKGALENLFSSEEEDTGSQVKCANADGECGIRPVPLALVSKISSMLSSHPAGIIMDELLRKVTKSNIFLDKDFFGHKNFLDLILSMPHVAKIRPHPTVEGRYIVYSAQNRSNGPQKLDSETSQQGVNHMSGDKLRSGEVDGKLPSPHEVNGKSSSSQPSLSVPNHSKDGSTSHLVTEANATVSLSSLKDANAENTAVRNHTVERSGVEVDDGAGNLSIPVEENVALVKDGFFERFWQTWLMGGSRVENNGHCNISSSRSASSDCEHYYQHTQSITQSSKDYEKGVSSMDASNRPHSDLPGDSLNFGEIVSPGVSEPKNSKGEDIQSKGTDSCSTVACYSPLHDSVAVGIKEHDGVASSSSSAFVRWIKLWCNFWKAGSEDSKKAPTDADKGLKMPIPNIASKESLGKNGDLGLQSQPHDLFSKPQFWQSMEYFLHISQGSQLVSNSTSRTHLVQGLQKEVPSILTSLKDCHILHLVDLLISEKKWILECTSRANPFKLAVSFRTYVPLDISAKNCKPVSSFANRKVETNTPKNVEELKNWYCKVVLRNGLIKAKDLKKKFERDFGKKLDSLSYGYSTLEDVFAVCSSSCNGNQDKEPKSSSLSREEMVSDCKSLIAEILENNPDGILLSSFKPMFLERFGYPLDCKMLGYSKLTPMLKEITGIKVEYEMILPSCSSYSDSSTDKQASKQPFDSDVEIDQHSLTADEDSSWDELGPPKEYQVNEYNESSIEEKNLPLEEVYVSEEDSNNVEYSKATGTDVLEDQGNKRNEDALLLQILESWHSCKESTGKTQPQSVHGLADCSAKINKKMES